MSNPERQQTIMELLSGLRGLDPLKQLFWSELSYQRVNQPLSRRGWPESASKALADDPVLFAGGGENNDFHVIYGRLTSNNLSRVLERPVVTQLLREHPYALFVFSNKNQTDWHFLNVKFDDQAERRRLYRRITVRPGAGLRTATERVQLLDLAEIHPELFGITPLAIQQRCDAAFDVEAVTKDFFTEVANWYFWALKNATFPKSAPKEADGHDHISIIRLITRLIFCWFVKEKGLIPDTLFDQQKLAATLTGFEPAKTSAKQSVFYKAILQNLFFATLNTEMDKRAWRKNGDHFMAHILYRHKTMFQKPSEALDLFKNIPFLNGGLFECLDKREGTTEKPKDIRIDGFSDRTDSQPTVPDFLFFGPEREVDLSEDYGDKKFKSVPVRGLIHIFNRYNFTVEEDTPIDQEVALDPELSGKVFENLLAAYNPETGATARKQTGSFYTPREIVNYMVDESLIACLKTKLEAALPSAKDVEARLRHLCAYTDEPHQFTAPEVDALIAAIDSLKTLDPAVGSGAFPMGVLHKLVFILGKLDPHSEKWKERQIQRVRNTIKEAEKTEDAARRDKMVGDLEEQISGINEAFRLNELDYGRKLYLIENCIYGVDIQPIAVQIAKMRFFISLIVDQKIDDKQPNRGVLPLPNLETKFVSANTLISIERPDTQGKLFTNAKVDKLKSDLLGIRHRMFTAKSPSTKQTLRAKDKAVREDLAQEIQKSLAKANEHEICQTRLELEKVRKTLEVALSKPVQWETQRIKNLFGEVEETRIDTGKDKRRRLQEQVKQLESKLLRANQRDADIDTTARRLANWDPYDQNASANFFDPEWMFGIVSGFDACVGNPPYRMLQPHNTDQSDLDYFREHYVSADFKIELFHLFLQCGTSLLHDSGCLAFIVPSSLLNNVYAEKLRRWLMDLCIIRTIAVSPTHVFAQADVHTAVVVFTREILAKKREDNLVATTTELTPQFARSPGEYGRTLQARFATLPGSVWNILLNESNGGLIEKLRKAGPTLESVSKINRGLITGDRKRYFSEKKLTEKHIPILTGADVERYSTKTPSEFVLFERPDSAGGCWDEDVHLAPHKLVVRQIGTKPTASFLAKPIAVTGNIFTIRSASRIQDLFLLGIVNSKLVEFFWKIMFSDFKSTFPQVTIFSLSQVPVAGTRTNSQGPNFANDRLVALVEEILTAKRKNPTADTSALEREIDKKVYALYGLTPEEITMVEAQT